MGNTIDLETARQKAYEESLNNFNWDEIVPFEVNKDISYPTESLDGISILKDLVKETAVFTQTDEGLVGTILLPVLTNCIQKKFRINVSVTENPEDIGYQEQLSIYALSALPTGDRKSPVFEVLTSPIQSYEFEYNKEREDDVKRYNNKVALLNEQIKSTRKVIANYKKNDESSLMSYKEKLNKYEEELIQLDSIYKKSLLENDITLERTASLMAENDGKLGIFSDEGGIIKTWEGKYDNTDIEIILNSYSGAKYSVRRQTREDYDIHKPSLSIGIATQYGTLQSMLDNVSFNDKGLNARFLFSRPRSLVGSRKIITTPVSDYVRNEYAKLINNLLNLEFENLQIIDFSKEAHLELIKYKERLEVSLNNELKEMRGWANKYMGNVIRICGLLHIVSKMDYFEEKRNPFIEPMDLEIFSKAKKISEYFMKNAKKIFLSTEYCKEYKDAEYVISKIKEHFNGKVKVNKRDLFQKCRAFKKTEQIHQSLVELIERNYIYVEPKYEKTFKVIMINPKVFV